jgi:hypothetical protein
LIASEGFSNSFVFHLIHSAELVFEREGFCYLHSILLSVILLIVVDQEAAIALNAPRTEAFAARFIAPLGSYVDLLLGVLLNICEDDAFWPSLVCILHMIAPSISIVSIGVASAILSLFEKVVERKAELIPLFLEAFASILQRNQSESNGFLVAFFPKYALFKKLIASTHRSGRALAVILVFLSEERKVAKSSKQQALPSDELARLLASVDADAVFPEKQVFSRHPHTVGGEMERTWAEWADLLFYRSFDIELKRLQKFKQLK